MMELSKTCTAAIERARLARETQTYADLPPAAPGNLHGHVASKDCWCDPEPLGDGIYRHRSTQ